jgi:hypothetical protein
MISPVITYEVVYLDPINGDFVDSDGEYETLETVYKGREFKLAQELEYPEGERCLVVIRKITREII